MRQPTLTGGGDLRGLLVETGTGKERIASVVHERSGRRGPRVAVNCGALPRSLLESELFGYRKGSFSGATQDRLGLIAASDGSDRVPAVQAR